MNKEQLERGIELQQWIEAIKEKIEASKAGLDCPERTFIRIHFYPHGTYELDTIMKKRQL